MQGYISWTNMEKSFDYFNLDELELAYKIS